MNAARSMSRKLKSGDLLIAGRFLHPFRAISTLLFDECHRGDGGSLGHAAIKRPSSLPADVPLFIPSASRKSASPSVGNFSMTGNGVEDAGRGIGRNPKRSGRPMDYCPKRRNLRSGPRKCRGRSHE